MQGGCYSQQPKGGVFVMRLILIAIAGFWISVSGAADRTWLPAATGCTSATFDTATCWQSSLLPATTDRALFNSALTYHVLWGDSTLTNWQAQTGSAFTTVTSDNLLVQNGNVTLRSDSLTPRIYRILNDVNVDTNGTLTIGAPGNPLVLQALWNDDVTNNAIVMDYGGTIKLAGAGNQLQITAAVLSVGIWGTGTLDITDGGKVAINAFGFAFPPTVIGANAGSTGTVNVDGAGSALNNISVTTIGSYGTGVLNITNGGSVYLGNRLGDYAGSNGTATVDGEGSLWTTSSNFDVGYHGTGTLNISNGGDVFTAGSQTSWGSIAVFADSTGTATVDGAGSTWTLSRFRVGGSGNGTLTISNGGSVVVNNATYGTTIASGASPNSTATVDGPGSSLTSPLINIAPAGTGTLSITNGGTVTIAGAVTVGTNGSVNLDGGNLQANTINAATGAFNFIGGTLKANAFTGNLVNQGGTLSPGQSPGMMTLTGSYTQHNQAALLVEINGFTAGSEYDVLNVTGQASLDGLLDVALSNALTITAGDTFDVLVADSFSGQFAEIGHRCITNSLRWNVIYDINPAGPDTLSLRAAPTPTPGICDDASTVVEIDVDPWSAANTVRPDSNDTIIVAVMGSSTANGDATDFDVHQIDPGSLKLGIGEAPNIAVNPLYGDYDHDSNSDAAFAFKTQGTGIFCDDPDVNLQGETFGGDPFEGTGAIDTIECESGGCHP